MNEESYQESFSFLWSKWNDEARLPSRHRDLSFFNLKEFPAGEDAELLQLDLMINGGRLAVIIDAGLVQEVVNSLPDKVDFRKLNQQDQILLLEYFFSATLEMLERDHAISVEITGVAEGEETLISDTSIAGILSVDTVELPFALIEAESSFWHLALGLGKKVESFDPGIECEFCLGSVAIEHDQLEGIVNGDVITLADFDIHALRGEMIIGNQPEYEIEIVSGNIIVTGKANPQDTVDDGYVLLKMCFHTQELAMSQLSVIKIGDSLPIQPLEIGELTIVNGEYPFAHGQIKNVDGTFGIEITEILGS